MKRRLLTNSFSNVSMMLLKLAVTFIMSPVIVRALGKYDYGIWEIVMSVVGYMGLLQFGLTPSIIRFVAKYNAEGNHDELDRLYSTSLLFMIGLSLVSFLCFTLWAFGCPELISQPGDSPKKYTIFILIIGIQSVTVFIGAVFQSFLHGYQRYGLTNVITAINTVVGSIAAYIVLSRGYGLLALAIFNSAGFSIKVCIYGLLLSRPRFGGHRFQLKCLSKQTFKPIFGFGLKSFVLGIASRLSKSTDSVVIGVFLGPAVVTLYVIPVNFVRNAVNMISVITQNFMPVFSDLSARGEHAQLRTYFLVASRYVTAIAVLMMLGIWYLGPGFIATWMGPEFSEKGRTVLYIILIAHMLPYLNPFHGRVLTGVNRHGVLAKIRTVEAICNITLSIGLVTVFDKEGVAVATLIPALIAEPFILVSVCKHLDLRVTDCIRMVHLPLLVPSLGALGSLHWLTIQVHMNSYFNIIFGAVTTSFVFLFLFALFSMEKKERAFIRQTLKDRLMGARTAAKQLL
ncbi:teichoic acid transporter [Desulfoluna limicola]|uniref:Teichoic acid transporter n=1 Tax=Desulfoluna limicola TaxID=2810562 RepID=A0ABM7PJ40_9BACT|nr:flippase [Desulfoluna limicola]BCS97092.1 teichoic acid transporter [Desulfoluna limicola]